MSCTDSITSFYPKINEETLFDGDNCPDVDERYDKDEYIGGSSKAGNYSLGPVDNFKLLSQEIDSPKYKIRTQEQQSEWSMKNTENKRQMSTYLLYFSYIRERLLEMCTQEKPIPLFGVLEEKGGDINLVRKPSLRVEVAEMLKEMRDPNLSKPVFDGYVIKIARTYNLNYSKFTKPNVLSLLEEFPEVSKDYEEYINCKAKGEVFSLFDEDKNLPDSVKDFEARAGHDFHMASSLVRNVKTLYLSSEALKERLVCTNLRSCFSLAMKHYHLVGGKKNINFEEKDLISEGATGLMHAVDLFVHGTSARFTTYAENWVRQKVTRYTKDTNSVRIPVHVSDLVYSIVKLHKERSRSGDCGLEIPPLTRELAEDILGKSIDPAIWMMAQNKLNGSSISVSCVTISGGEDDFSFDNAMSNRSESLDDSSPNLENEKVKALIDVINGLKSEKGIEKKDRPGHFYSITERQYDFFRKHFLDGMSYEEISRISKDEVTTREVKLNVEVVTQNIKEVISFEDLL